MEKGNGKDLHYHIVIHDLFVDTGKLIGGLGRWVSLELYSKTEAEQMLSDINKVRKRTGGETEEINNEKEICNYCP